MKICYIFPSRSRPDKFFETIDTICAQSMKDNYFIVASLDFDDAAMTDASVRSRFAGYEKLLAIYGSSTGKVNAINRDLACIPDDTDIVILISDDMVITQHGFDEIIRGDMQKYFPDKDGVLHYPDGTPVRERVITLSIMGINYFKRFNYLYHPEYTSVWCDVEFTEVAKMLGKYQYVKNSNWFVHDHPVWTNGKVKYDALMTRNESFYHKDKEVYFKRQKNNFDIK